MAVDSYHRQTDKQGAGDGRGSVGLLGQRSQRRGDRPPLPQAGPRTPMPMVMPAVTMDATAIIVMLSILYPLLNGRLLLINAGSGCKINCSQNTENISLHHAGEQTEQRHDNRKNKGRDRQ